MQNEAKFLTNYKYAFTFAQEKGKRNVEVELANGLWDLLIGSGKCQFLSSWKTFLSEKAQRGEILVVTKDTWDLFYELVKQTRGNLANFVDDGSWPSLIDEFVAYYNSNASNDASAVGSSRPTKGKK